MWPTRTLPRDAECSLTRGVLGGEPRRCLPHRQRPAARSIVRRPAPAYGRRCRGFVEAPARRGRQGACVGDEPAVSSPVRLSRGQADSPSVLLGLGLSRSAAEPVAQSRRESMKPAPSAAADVRGHLEVSGRATIVDHPGNGPTSVRRVKRAVPRGRRAPAVERRRPELCH